MAKVLGTALAESPTAVLVVGVPVTVALPALKYVWQSRFSVKIVKMHIAYLAISKRENAYVLQKREEVTEYRVIQHRLCKDPI